MRDYPNMSYCMYENTTLALRQILNDLAEANESFQSFEQYMRDRSSQEERIACRDFADLLDEVQDMLAQLNSTTH